MSKRYYRNLIKLNQMAKKKDNNMLLIGAGLVGLYFLTQNKQSNRNNYANTTRPPATYIPTPYIPPQTTKPKNWTDKVSEGIDAVLEIVDVFKGNKQSEKMEGSFDYIEMNQSASEYGADNPYNSTYSNERVAGFYSDYYGVYNRYITNIESL